MEFENKILSREINTRLYESGLTLGTAESCTGGHIAEAIISAPGSSNYFKGAIVSYVNEIKERLLGVSPELIAEQTAVCEDVAKAMVRGACHALQTTYAIASTGIAGPGGGTPAIPVGTIWLACGTPDDIVTLKLTGDQGRDLNISNAAHRALTLFLDFLNHHETPTEEKD